MIKSGILADIQRCIDQKEPVIAEHPTTTSQGVWALLRYYLSPIPGTDGTVSGVMAIVEDYTDLKRTIVTLRQSERRFRDQALRDDLTGLYNQRYLYHSLTRCIERAQTTGYRNGFLKVETNWKSILMRCTIVVPIITT